MKSYRLKISVLVSAVGIFTLLIFSLVLLVFRQASSDDIFNMITSYGYLIAPAGLAWVFANRYLWHTKLFQLIRKSANIPPDLRGRWEGELQNAENGNTQKFAIEIKQTLTTLHVFSYSTVGRSVSLLPDITSSENEDTFSLCFLWQGETHTPMKHAHTRMKFNGYTILTLNEYEHPKMLKGVYFTSHRPNQTRGKIELVWVSKELKKRLE